MANNALAQHFPARPIRLVVPFAASGGDIIIRAQWQRLSDCLANQGAEALTSTPEQFAAYIKSEIAKCAKIERDTGVAVR